MFENLYVWKMVRNLVGHRCIEYQTSETTADLSSFVQRKQSRKIRKHFATLVFTFPALASFLLAQYAGEIDTDCMDFISNDCDRISPGVLSAEAATEPALL
jgi:hypothetical protein